MKSGHIHFMKVVKRLTRLKTMAVCIALNTPLQYTADGLEKTSWQWTRRFVQDINIDKVDGRWFITFGSDVLGDIHELPEGSSIEIVRPDENGDESLVKYTLVEDVFIPRKHNIDLLKEPIYYSDRAIYTFFRMCTLTNSQGKQSHTYLKFKDGRTKRVNDINPELYSTRYKIKEFLEDVIEIICINEYDRTQFHVVKNSLGIFQDKGYTL